MMDVRIFLWLCLIVRASAQLPGGKSCFCKFHENVDECECSVDTVDDFNNKLIYPLLQQLLERDYFRYYKVNMEKTCPFWPDDRECSTNQCGIENCDDEVPEMLKANENRACIGKPTSKESENDEVMPSESAVLSNELDPLDMHLSADMINKLDMMDRHDYDEDKYCDIDDEDLTLMHYVDLHRNPERYTGYAGKGAAMVWKSIYQENCFKPNPKFDKNFLLSPSITGLCLEKRVFFRVISGLHTSITISIAAHNYVPPPGGFGVGTWKRNMEMFKARFSPETTWGEGPQRLKNLYFVYLLELRALHKLEPYLRANEHFYTGNEKEDQETRRLVQQLHDAISNFPDHFDETAMFQMGNEALSRELKEEFRLHFWNVSRIMDCVGCDKCRLWGKLQTHGIGTAFKILFADAIQQHRHVSQDADQLPFYLTRNDVVALLQSFGRFASSIYEVAAFRSLLNT